MSTPPLPYLTTSTTLAIRSAEVQSISAYFDSVDVSAMVAIAVRNPETPTKCALRLTVGVHSNDSTFNQQIEIMLTSSLITKQVGADARALRSKLKSWIKPPDKSYGTYARHEADTAFDKSLASAMTAGATFCILGVEGHNSALTDFLARVPSSAWITPPRATVCYFNPGGLLGGRGFWELGSLSTGSIGDARNRLGDMVSRGKLSDEAAETFRPWIDQALAETRRIPLLHLSRHDL